MTLKPKLEPLLSLEEKHYDPSQIEEVIYKKWLAAKCFECNPKSQKPPYSIVIPPPNVTGRLHMGHALNNTVQDCLCRYKRMDGFDVMWVPGTDHAGISTQSVVKKHLDSQGIDFKQLGREEVIRRIWEWKDKYGNQILNQLERLGSSCDWSKTRFTMDEGLSTAVRFAFKKLYDDGLIYRGKYIVNWCPVDRTALSDDEVSTKEGGEPGFIWHVKYALENGSGFVTIATTRPETILGDSAIAVNPKDSRYQKIVGQMVRLPLTDRLIPIIADDYADPEFGTGCLKVTPAHDINDFQIGLRHNLPQINVMNDDATMGDQAPKSYHGLDRFTCREKIVKELKELGVLEKVEERMTPVGRAQRSGAIIEYRLSDQWFVKMQPLAKHALNFTDNGDLKLFPERWEKIYRQWLENTRDWCISRQIWWGHQIPAWYHKTSDQILVDSQTPKEVLENPDEWEQDQDVLDTWFSSALWPYSTMNWPQERLEDNELLSRYYPTSVLSTAKDIIYFWVARMVMTGTHFLNQVPFREVYFHPVICDAKGETMSKSKGNGIDPIHVIEGATVKDLEGPIRDARPVAMKEMLAELHSNYPNGFEGVGADALRITLLSLNSQAQQVQLSLKKFDETGKRFSEKLWNASRFVLSKISDGFDFSLIEDPKSLSLEDRWILGQLDQTIATVREGFDTYSFNESINALLRFFWDDICDWYLEVSKAPLKDKDSKEALIKRSVLAHVYLETLKLLHPVVPFITEELWSHLKNIQKPTEQDQFIGELKFPETRNIFDQSISQKFSQLQDVVREIRNCKTQSGLAAGSKLKATFKGISLEQTKLIIENSALIQSAANLESLAQVDQKPDKSISCILNDLEIYLDISGTINVDAEIDRNQKALIKIEKEITNLEGRLANKNFVDRAPKNVLEENQAQLQAWIEKRDKTKSILNELKG